MIARLRGWLEETHSDTFELVRHFLARFFDTEIGASAGDWQKVGIGIFASLVSLGLLGLNVYQARFRILQDPLFSTPQKYHSVVREDLIGLLAIVMGITALLTLLQWQSLFPSLRDYLALAGFPVSARQIFLAKFTALILLAAAFVLSLTGPLAGFFAWVISGRWMENPSGPAIGRATFAALAGGCCFVFFSLLAVQGILLNLVPGRWFMRVSQFVQAALFIVTVGALPLLGRQPAGAVWWPPSWFVQLWEALVTGSSTARPALLAIVLPPVIAVLAYLLSYHRYRKLLLEAPADRAGGQWSGWGSRLLERWIPNPREQAAFAFTWKTLARSPIHRLLLFAYAGLALGWVIKAALDAPPVALHDEGHVRADGGRVPSRARRADDSGAALPVLATGDLEGQLDVPDGRSGRSRRLAGRRAALRHRVRHRPGISGQPAGIDCDPRLAARAGGHRIGSDGRAALLRTPFPGLVQASLYLFLHPGQAAGLADAVPLLASA